MGEGRIRRGVNSKRDHLRFLRVLRTKDNESLKPGKSTQAKEPLGAPLLLLKVLVENETESVEGNGAIVAAVIAECRRGVVAGIQTVVRAGKFFVVAGTARKERI